jgi:quinol monooxygenase YgiN
VAVVSMMRMQGDPDELAAAIREHVTPVARTLAEKHGGLLNIVARRPDGILAINLWENEEGRQAMAAEPEIQQAVAAAGLPAPAFEGYEVLELNVTEAFVTQAAASR